MFNLKKDKNNQKYIEVELDGAHLIEVPFLNKGRAFSEEERSRFRLHGLLPVTNIPLDQTIHKIYDALCEIEDPLKKHIYLRNVQDRNETLFYALINAYIEELMPLIYTPVVGSACQNFAKIYRKPRGLFVSYEDKDRLDELFDHSYFENTKVIVVSDGERILGLGDQGTGGMGIPIGKLSLYIVCAGIAPFETLPILLDVGTDSEELLNDPNYLGLKRKRIRGEVYDDFIDKFVQTIKRHFPTVLLQWEDFAQSNALRLLEKYQDQLCTFNDDIQGTASIVVGALLSAVNMSGIPLIKQKIVVVGGGSAGVGISNLIVEAMIEEGLTQEQARANISLVDRYGLITDKQDSLDFQKPFVKAYNGLSLIPKDPENVTLLETVKAVKATMMIGVCGQLNIFTQEVIEQLAENCERPIIFPLSNPITKAEANPHDVLNWTHSKAIVGTGSPFPEYSINGKLRRIDQVNNAYIFPGIGLGVRAVNSTRVTDRMFLVAAKALAELSPAKNDSNANLLPPLGEIRSISRHIAIAVAKEAVASNLTKKHFSEKEIIELIDDYVWEPVYLPYIKVPYKIK